MFRRVVGLEHARLTLVGLGEGVATLLTHTLNLPNLPNGLLELLHSNRMNRQQGDMSFMGKACR